MVFHQQNGLWIAWSERLEFFVILMSKNSISGWWCTCCRSCSSASGSTSPSTSRLASWTSRWTTPSGLLMLLVTKTRFSNRSVNVASDKHSYLRFSNRSVNVASDKHSYLRFSNSSVNVASDKKHSYLRFSKNRSVNVACDKNILTWDSLTDLLMLLVTKTFLPEIL